VTREPKRGEVSVGASSGNTPWDQLGKEGAMYISGGVLALIVIVVLLIWLL
jgi:hypothetical protein